MYESHTIKLTSAGKKFWKTRKNTMRIVVIDKPVELHGGYWDGGSRSEYFGMTKNGQMVGLSYPTSPREFGGGVAPSTMPTKELAICSAGTFRGNPASVTAYVTALEDWNRPELGTKVIK